MEKLYNGVYKLSVGEPEKITPVSQRKELKNIRSFEQLSDIPVCINESKISFEISARGCTVELPLEDDEQIYGFGLHLKSFSQKGKKKMLRMNADPSADTGDSHAPIPFYVSTKGYGVLVDSARYVTFYCGANTKKRSRAGEKPNRGARGSVEELYSQEETLRDRCMTIDIPSVKGAELYFFSGPTLKDSIRRYNLFSGGGAMPPLWGMGIWYRAYFDSLQEDVIRLADSFRESNIPCNVIGLEPGWLSRAYSASFCWNKEKFPDHESFIEYLTERGYKINLWEHIFIHSTAPFYEEIYPYSGDFEVWNGIVPDFAVPEAEDIFSKYHKKEFVEKNISGFKIDECDSSDYTGGWSYPNCSKFPSGMDGEQMHNMMGLLYQRTMKNAYDSVNLRTWGLVRASYALASSYPFVLYSDLYKHEDFIRGMANMGFGGILWTPEVRSAESADDLIRRMQSVCFSPLSLINAWPFPNPPWMQINEDLNKKGIMQENISYIEELCKEIFALRMSLIPYLYTAFYEYHKKGIPPVRALVMDWPDDSETYNIDDCIMVGDCLYYAPIIAGSKIRRFYLPEGQWINFFDNSQKLQGGKWYEFEYEIDMFPLYVKNGSLLPLAEPCQYVEENTVFKIMPELYGDIEGEQAIFVLYEDDGISNDYMKNEFNLVTVFHNSDGYVGLKREGNYLGIKYELTK